MDEGDDDALSWAGDEDLAPRRTARESRVLDDDDEEAPGGRFAPVLAMLGVALLVETALWVQSVFFGPLATTLGQPDGTVVGVLAWGLVLAVRIVGALSPLVWFAVATALNADQGRRAAVLLVGVVLLLPWPALVRLL